MHRSTNRFDFMSSCAVLALLVSASMLYLSACQSRQAADPRSLTAMVSVEGSDTMTELVTELAKAFMQENANVPVSVTSGDTGAGISALINKTTDLAAASRDLTPQEEKLAREKHIRLKRVTVARDSIAVVVHPDNPIKELSLKQLKNIYTGSTKSWSELGGPDEAITVFTREPGSGTGRYFKEHVLEKGNYVKSAKVFNSHEAIVKEIDVNPWSIGYVAMGFVTANSGKVKPVELKLTSDSAPVEATRDSTVGFYPLSRPLFMFHDRDSKESVQRFVDFCLSDDGQKAVASAGFVAVKH